MKNHKILVIACLFVGLLICVFLVVQADSQIPKGEGGEKKAGSIAFSQPKSSSQKSSGLLDIEEVKTGVSSSDAVNLDFEKDGSLAVALDQARRRVAELTPVQRSLAHNRDVTLFASNPEQEMTARYLPGMVRFESGTDMPKSKWAVSFALNAICGIATTQKTEPIISSGSSDTVHFRHSDEIVEWYKNSTAGIEHGLTLKQRPDASGQQVTLNFDVLGASVESDTSDGSLILNDPSDESALLRYKELKVFDASGRMLSSSMKPDGEGFEIAYNDTGAVYPITVDPIIINERRLLDPLSGDAESGFGRAFSIDETGNFLYVGAPFEDRADATDAGVVYVFGASGDTYSYQGKIEPATPIAGEHFGSSIDTETLPPVASNPQTNIPLIAIGAPGDEFREGNAVYLYESSAPLVFDQVARFTEPSFATFSHFGDSVHLAGEWLLVTDDVAAPNDFEFREAGAAYLYERKPTGWELDTTLTAPQIEDFSYFASVADFDGNTVALSTAPPGENSDIFIFRNSNGSWSLVDELETAETAQEGGFGHQVSSISLRTEFSPFRAVVGSRRSANLAGGEGNVFILSEGANGWTEEGRVSPPSDDLIGFGGSLSFDGLTVITTTREAVYFISQSSAGIWEIEDSLPSNFALPFPPQVGVYRDSALVYEIGNLDRSGSFLTQFGKVFVSLNRQTLAKIWTART